MLEILFHSFDRVSEFFGIIFFSLKNMAEMIRQTFRTKEILFFVAIIFDSFRVMSLTEIRMFIFLLTKYLDSMLIQILFKTFLYQQIYFLRFIANIASDIYKVLFNLFFLFLSIKAITTKEVLALKEYWMFIFKFN